MRTSHTQNTNKTQLLASNYGTFRALLQSPVQLTPWQKGRFNPCWGRKTPGQWEKNSCKYFLHTIGTKASQFCCLHLCSRIFCCLPSLLLLGIQFRARLVQREIQSICSKHTVPNHIDTALHPLGRFQMDRRRKNIKYGPFLLMAMGKNRGNNSSFTV